MIGVALALLALAPMSEAQLTKARSAAPADVRGFVDRWESCAHWGGEEPYDKDRARQINRAVKQLRCDRLEHDEGVLGHRYAHVASILALLSAAHDLY